MDSRAILDIIYALAARDGRQAVLFGDCAADAREAFSRSLANEGFGELWFEIPLTGDPWFDLHVLINHEEVAGKAASFSGLGGIYQDALAWFCNQPMGTVRQLALSYDSHTGDIDNPAVQLLVSGTDPSVALGFLEAVGRQDAQDGYVAFTRNMPREWFACYVGTFPGRRAEGDPTWTRVECIVGQAAQEAYAQDAAHLRDHLAQLGMAWLADGELEAIQNLARSPFPLEFQFNVGAKGEALSTISASVRFSPTDWMRPERRERIQALLHELEAQGLADSRVGELGNTCFAKRMRYRDESGLLSCFPAFVKLRWRTDGQTDAKAYLVGGFDK